MGRPTPPPTMTYWRGLLGEDGCQKLSGKKVIYTAE